jgi:hypothetical protein
VRFLDFKPSCACADEVHSLTATISGKMISKKDGKVLSVAEHNKAAVDFKAGSVL